MGTAAIRTPIVDATGVIDKGGVLDKRCEAAKQHICDIRVLLVFIQVGARNSGQQPARLASGGFGNTGSLHLVRSRLAEEPYQARQN